MIQYLQVEYFHPCLNILYAKAFSYLEALEEQPYVPIVISSYGGYTDCLSTLLDCIQGSSKPVVVISTGVAMSCGADLFASGTKGLRIVGPNTTTLIHQVSGCAWGKASDMEAENRETQRVNEQFLYKLFDKTGNHPEGFTKNLIKENFNADLYLTPEQMIEYGWADKIMPINQALINLDSIFDDYKKQLEAVELSEEMSEFIGDLDRCKPKDDEDKKKMRGRIMFKSFMNKIFNNLHTNEQLEIESKLRDMTSQSVIREFDIKKFNNKMENTKTMEQQNELVQEVEQIEAPKTEDVVEAVSEETEVVEEQPKNEAEEIEPSEAETAEAEIQEEPAKEEPQEDEQPLEVQAEEIEEQEQQEEPQELEVQEEQKEEPKIENVETITNVKVTNESPIEIKTVVKENSGISNEAKLLAEIEALKAENAKKEIALAKSQLAKEVELDFAGVPGKVDEKTDFVYEIKNSTLSKNAKGFILNSLKSLSEQNLADCKEVGHSQEVEIDEATERQNKIEQAIKEHGLTENQAFLYVNGDKTLMQAKKTSEKLRNQKR